MRAMDVLPPAALSNKLARKDRHGEQQRVSCGHCPTPEVPDPNLRAARAEEIASRFGPTHTQGRFEEGRRGMRTTHSVQASSAAQHFRRTATSNCGPDIYQWLQTPCD